MPTHKDSVVSNISARAWKKRVQIAGGAVTPPQSDYSLPFDQIRRRFRGPIYLFILDAFSPLSSFSRRTFSAALFLAPHQRE